MPDVRCAPSKDEGVTRSTFENSNAIYISGLPPDVTVDQLNDQFKMIGTIATKKVGRNRWDRVPKISIYKDDRGKCKGDAIITYEDPSAALHAPEFFNGCVIASASLAAKQIWETERRDTPTTWHRCFSRLSPPLSPQIDIQVSQICRRTGMFPRAVSAFLYISAAHTQIHAHNVMHSQPWQGRKEFVIKVEPATIKKKDPSEMGGGKGGGRYGGGGGGRRGGGAS